MPSKILGKPVDEAKWAKAKARAAEEGQAGNYAYIMTIYKRMAHLDKSIRGLMRESIKSTGRFKLVIGGDLDEYRCDSCGKLLMKGTNLEKSVVEIKCKWCGALARTH